MKEATGELNMTVVTVVAIAALIAFFYLVIWPTVKVNMALTTACTSAGNSEYDSRVGGQGEGVACQGGICTYYNEDGGEGAKKTCDSQAN